MNENALRIQPTSEDLQERFEALQHEFERATSAEQASFAFLAQCRESCRSSETAFERSGEVADLQTWKDAESVWVRAREEHSDAHVRKTTLKIQVETLRYHLRRRNSEISS